MTAVKEQRRANMGLRTLAEALGVDEDSFFDFVAEAIHAIG